MFKAIIRFNLIITLLCAVCLSNTAVAFQDKFNIEQDKPVDVIADTLYYDKSTKTAYAIGRVEIQQSNQIIYADEAVYNREVNTIYAKGNVVVKRPNGDVFFSDEMKFERNATNGVAAKFSARMSQKSLLASKNAVMVDDNTIELEEMVFSPCKVCESNLRALFPLWQFRASKATLDQKEETIYYKHARMEALGIPFFYTPYMTSPAPGAKRKSGFLPPKYILNSNNLGSALKTPYYINIARNMDATISPTFTKEAGILLEGEFRHRIKEGDYTLKGGVVNADKTTKQGDVIKGKEMLKAYYDIDGRFKLHNDWHTGNLLIKSRKIHDPTKTFLKKYKISEDQILNTDVSYTVYEDNYYASIRGLQFQDLRPDHNNKTTPAALPILDYHHSLPVKRIGGILNTDVNYTNLMRLQGASYNRLSVRESIKFPFILPYGNLLTTTASIRGDAYNTVKKDIIVKDTQVKLLNKRGGDDGRLYPELKSEWSLPLIQRFKNSVVVIEPVVNAIIAPDKHNLKKIDNEDSEFPEISAANLFTANRYIGFDRLESGVRANYGARFNVKTDYFKNLSILAGQNIRAKKDNNFNRHSGLDGHSSDYVSKLAFEYDEHISFLMNTRYSDEDSRIMRNESNVNLSYTKWNFSLSHYLIDKALLDDKTRYKEEITMRASYNLINEWWIDGEISSKLGKKIPSEPVKKIRDGVGLRYVGDCLLMGFAVQRDFAKLKDLRPETTYLITLDIPVF